MRSEVAKRILKNVSKETRKIVDSKVNLMIKINKKLDSVFNLASKIILIIAIIFVWWLLIHKQIEGEYYLNQDSYNNHNK